MDQYNDLHWLYSYYQILHACMYVYNIYLDLYPKPKRHDSLSVDLTPDVENGEDERRAENHQTQE